MDDERQRWVERVATFCVEEWGLPPITGRVLGWLMICDPPEQSAGGIADAIQTSRASLTSNIAEEGFAITGHEGPRAERIRAARESLTWLRDLAARNPPEH
jgi:hypothetical protein